MKNLLVLMFLSVSFLGFGQLQGGVQWEEDQKLTWSDFQGRSDARSHHHALTASGISIDMKQISNDSIAIIVESKFYPKQSWLKKGKDSDHLLNHEQRHFDIAEVFRRRLIKELMESKTLRTKKINQVVDKLYNANDRALLKYQSLYDKETQHSQMTDKQEIWDKKIDDELEELAAFDIKQFTFSMELVMTRTSSKTKKTSTRKKSSRKKRRG